MNKPIAGAVRVPRASRYCITKHGRIYSSCSGEWKLLSPGLVGYGYRALRLCHDDGIYRGRYIHHLVAHAFIGPMPEDCDLIRHLDGDRENNSWRNLAYGTQFDNMQDARRLGRLLMGSKNPMAKLCESDVLAIRAAIAGGRKASELMKQFKVSRMTISRIKTKELWKHI